MRTTPQFVVAAIAAISVASFGGLFIACGGESTTAGGTKVAAGAVLAGYRR